MFWRHKKYRKVIFHLINRLSKSISISKTPEHLKTIEVNEESEKEYLVRQIVNLELKQFAESIEQISDKRDCSARLSKEAYDN